jgi:hypothetical protein
MADETANDENDIVNVAQTDVERQSIGNCWIYAHASWIESMNKSATGASFDLSQSYWTYWHWFDQIASGFGSEISTGGNYTTASNIVRKYGLMSEGAFVDTDTQNEMSSRQSSALATINDSLKNGALKETSARRDRLLVRRELDRAWGLTADVVDKLNRAFGESVTRTFSSTTSPASAEGTDIVRGQDFKVTYTTSPGGAPVQRNLVQAQSEWRQVYYRAGDRQFQIRVQKALHDAQPVIITWFVDFNAMENRTNELRGSFNMTTLNEFGPGRQGGHMTVLEDYQAKLADGRVLKAGETLDPTNPEQKALLDTALASSSEVQFFRVKNSWGAARPDRAFAPGMPGYHDLHMSYLDGPVKKCAERNGQTDTTSCTTQQTPLKYVILPPGF